MDSLLSDETSFLPLPKARETYFHYDAENRLPTIRFVVHRYLLFPYCASHFTVCGS